MEIKWLEDFLSLARTRSFSRSAEERHITQSAFSRRIQSMEQWLGVAIIDRSCYPTALTPAGREFLETAEEAVRILYSSRSAIQTSAKPDAQTVSIAAVHTLSLRFFPRWFGKVAEKLDKIKSRLISNDYHSCVQAIVEGNYDFLLTFYHSDVPVFLEQELFPHLIVGIDKFVVACCPKILHLVGNDETIPLLIYPPSSFLGRVATVGQVQLNGLRTQILHTNENAMAEALKFMVLEGHGAAWLPRSLIIDELNDGSLALIGPELDLEIRLYRNARRTRAVVENVWNAALQIASVDMKNLNDAF